MPSPTKEVKLTSGEKAKIKRGLSWFYRFKPEKCYRAEVQPGSRFPFQFNNIKRLIQRVLRNQVWFDRVLIKLNSKNLISNFYPENSDGNYGLVEKTIKLERESMLKLRLRQPKCD